MRSILSSKLKDGQIVCVKAFEFEKPSTKEAAKALQALDLNGKRITLVIANDDINTFLSFRNIPGVEILPVNNINAYDLLDNRALVIQDNCLKYIEEVLA